MHIINPTLRRTLKEIEKERLKNSLKLNLLPNNKEGLAKLWENYKEMRLNKLKIRYMSYYAKFFLGEFSLLGPKHKYREGLKEDMLTHVLSEYRNLAQNFINLLDQRFAYDKDRNVFYRNKSSIPTISDSLSYDYGFSDELNDAYASLYLFAKNLKVSAHFLNLPDLNMESYPTIPFEIHNLHNEPITRSIDNSEAIDPKGWGIKERPTQNMERIGLLGRSRKGRINMLLLKKFLKSKQFDILRNQYNDTDELTKPEYI